jgi:GNAT superfamily N-acetyltransferase
MHYELSKGEFTLSTNPDRLDRASIHEFLSNSYWAKHRPREVFEKALENSLCFGLYHSDQQVGFARVISDHATFAYLADVYILEPYRGRGLAKWLITNILAHPKLKEVRRWLLTTKDAHKLYRECGFSGLKEPEHHMQLLQPYPGELAVTEKMGARLREIANRIRKASERSSGPRSG